MEVRCKQSKQATRARARCRDAYVSNAATRTLHPATCAAGVSVRCCLAPRWLATIYCKTISLTVIHSKTISLTVIDSKAQSNAIDCDPFQAMQLTIAPLPPSQLPHSHHCFERWAPSCTEKGTKFIKPAKAGVVTESSEAQYTFLKKHHSKIIHMRAKSTIDNKAPKGMASISAGLTEKTPLKLNSVSLRHREQSIPSTPCSPPSPLPTPLISHLCVDMCILLMMLCSILPGKLAYGQITTSADYLAFFLLLVRGSLHALQRSIVC